MGILSLQRVLSNPSAILLLCRREPHPSSDPYFCPSVTLGFSSVSSALLLWARCSSEIRFLCSMPSPCSHQYWLQLHAVAVSGLILPQGAGCGVETGKGTCLGCPASTALPHLSEEGGGLGRSLSLLAQGSWAPCILWSPCPTTRPGQTDGWTCLAEVSRVTECKCQGCWCQSCLILPGEVDRWL